MTKQIKSVEELKRLANVDGGIECFIALNAGLRSSKKIEWMAGKKQFFVFNYIDDTAIALSEKELFTLSNIGAAIGKGALYLED